MIVMLSVKEKTLAWLEATAIRKLDKCGMPCEMHNLRDYPDADACPCHVKLIWESNRLDESIHRLKIRQHSILRWYIWFLRSSTKSFGFPKESIDFGSQVGQPIAAWQKYGVPQRNSVVATNHPRGFIYYKREREVSARPAISTALLDI